MNIQQAKKEIMNAIKAYLMKDEFGDYRISTVRQRPILLIGAPGIGKTAIMEQIAQEMGIGLVAYSMTHHTRQSAIGLPYIEHKTYGGEEYAVSEYTMSEIVASVYDQIEKSGLKEGILFLDEINCVSETLSPAMLQFLQYKIFGKHHIPDGWIIVTAGNPPEYNKSVREFDVVTLDRVKRIMVEPDLAAWKNYALQKGIHGAILSYLDIKKKDFYLVETTVDGKAFVTARGWEDLSEMIQLYEEMGEPVTEQLVVQYLQQEKIAKEFAIYYDLYNKYKSDYQIDEIMKGNVTDEIRARAQEAKFDERITLMSLLLDAANGRMTDDLRTEENVADLLSILKEVKAQNADKKNTLSVEEILEEKIAKREGELEDKINTGILRKADERKLKTTIATLKEYLTAVKREKTHSNEEAFALVKSMYDAKVEDMKASRLETKTELNNMFTFIENTFGSGQEMLLVVTELTANANSARFISKHGCEKYFEHNKELLFYERQQGIMHEIDLLEKMEVDPNENELG